MKKVILYTAALGVLVLVGATFAASIGGSSGRMGLPFFGGKSFSMMRLSGGDAMVEERRELGNFDSISLPGSGRVRVSIGTTPSVMVKAGERAIQRIVTELRGTELVISGNFASLGGSPEFEVVAPSLKAVRVSGSGDIEVLDTVKGDSLQIDIAGSGSVKAGVELRGLTVRIAGSGDVRLDGKAEKMELRVMGSGDLDAADLDGGTASVSILGSGDGSIGDFAELDAIIAGSGDLRYDGSPRIKGSTPGSGKLIPR
jgi:hypothetical protein